MENDRVAEGELDQLRKLLIQDEPLPPGVVARLEAAVRRDRSARNGIGWEPRIGIACVCFIVTGQWSRSPMNVSVAVVLTLVALLYSWTALGTRVVVPQPADRVLSRKTG